MNTILILQQESGASAKFTQGRRSGKWLSQVSDPELSSNKNS